MVHLKSLRDLESRADSSLYFRANIVGKMITEQATVEAKADSQLAFERLSAMTKASTRKLNKFDSLLSNANLKDNAQRQQVIQKLMMKLNKNIENRTLSDLTLGAEKKVLVGTIVLYFNAQ